MQVVADGDVPHLVLLDTLRLVLVNFAGIDHADRLSTEEGPGAREAGLDSPVAVWVLPVLGLRPSKELLRCVIELADHDFAGCPTAFSQPLKVFVLLAPAPLSCFVEWRPSRWFWRTFVR